MFSGRDGIINSFIQGHGGDIFKMITFFQVGGLRFSRGGGGGGGGGLDFFCKEDFFQWD